MLVPIPEKLTKKGLQCLLDKGYMVTRVFPLACIFNQSTKDLRQYETSLLEGKLIPILQNYFRETIKNRKQENRERYEKGKLQ